MSEISKSNKNIHPKLMSLLNVHSDANDLDLIKQLGRKELTNTHIKHLVDWFEQETNSNLKREIISSIGRQRNKKNINLLMQFIEDDDPKIILQAIRGLCCFPNDSKITAMFHLLENHPNEVVREFITNRLETKQTKKNVVRGGGYEKTSYSNKIINNNALFTLKKIKNEIIDLTFTSPPYYNARDYSIYKSYDQYLNFLESVFKELYRITREGRFFILNTSPVIEPRTSRQTASKRYAIPFDIHPRIIDMGFEFIDDIIWKKPAPCAKNRNGGFFQHRKPLGYKPNCIVEYVMVYRKKTDKLLDWNMKQYDSETIEQSKVTDNNYEKTNVWDIAPSTSKKHPAVFPEKLADNIIRYYSYAGDLVLDPFAGSGTVGLSCKSNNRNFFLIDSNQNYVRQMIEMLNERL